MAADKFAVDDGDAGGEDEGRAAGEQPEGGGRVGGRQIAQHEIAEDVGPEDRNVVEGAEDDGGGKAEGLAEQGHGEGPEDDKAPDDAGIVQGIADGLQAADGPA